MMRVQFALAVALGVSACNHAGHAGGDDDAAGSDSGSGSDGSTTCGEAATCTAWNVSTTCGVSTTCPGGCFQGACAANACTDECGLGDTGPLGTCRLWDMTAAAFVDADPAGSLHDRARDYDRIQRIDHLPEGGVTATIYTAPDLKTLSLYDGITDSALWTGTMLAAHSWRHLATGSPDAAARLALLAHTLHIWLNLGQSPGYLARFAASEDHAN